MTRESEKQVYFDESIKLLGPEGSEFTVKQSLAREEDESPVLSTAIVTEGRAVTEDITINDDDKILDRLTRNTAELADELMSVRNMVAGYIYAKTGEKATTVRRQSDDFKALCAPVLRDYLKEYLEDVTKALKEKDAYKALEKIHPVLTPRRVLQFIHKAMQNQVELHLDKIEKDIVQYDEECSKMLSDYAREIQVQHDHRMSVMTEDASIKVSDPQSIALQKLAWRTSEALELYSDLWTEAARQLRQLKKIDPESLKENAEALAGKIMAAKRAYERFHDVITMDTDTERETSELPDMRPILEDMAENAKVFSNMEALQEHIGKRMSNLSLSWP
jgi:hypothetical protein